MNRLEKKAFVKNQIKTLSNEQFLDAYSKKEVPIPTEWLTIGVQIVIKLIMGIFDKKDKLTKRISELETSHQELELRVKFLEEANQYRDN